MVSDHTWDSHVSEQLLDGERSHLVVAISGCVVSETPIKSELTGLRGVVVEETVCRLQFLTSINNLFFYKNVAFLILAFGN
jgi:hypothetical protein